jgi:hypothetical protein
MLTAKGILAALVVVGLSAGLASADDVAANKMKLKAGNPTKQQVQVLSKDEAADAGAPTGPERPTVGGASLHVYGAEIDQCFGLGPKTSWDENGNVFKYKAGNFRAKVKADYLTVKLKGAPKSGRTRTASTARRTARRRPAISR